MRPVLKSMLRGHLVGIAQAKSKGFAKQSSKFVAGAAPAFLSHVRTNGAHDLNVAVFKNFTLSGQTDTAA
jgi:hypothetical protein